MRVCLEDHMSEGKASLSLLFLLQCWKVSMIKSRSVFDLALVTQIQESTALISTLLLFVSLFRPMGQRQRWEIWINHGGMYIWISLIQPSQFLHLMVDH